MTLCTIISTLLHGAPGKGKPAFDSSAIECAVGVQSARKSKSVLRT